jgi:hypothetical protein
MHGVRDLSDLPRLVDDENFMYEQHERNFRAVNIQVNLHTYGQHMLCWGFVSFDNRMS